MDRPTTTTEVKNIIDEENPFHIEMKNVPRDKYTENPVLPQKIESEEIKALEQFVNEVESKKSPEKAIMSHVTLTLDLPQPKTEIKIQTPLKVRQETLVV